MTRLWVIDNNCVKYYPDPTWQWGVMARDTYFGYVCTVILTLEMWPWVKVMTHPWVMDNNLCEILSRSNMAVTSYDLDTEFWYVCNLTLTLETWPWVKVMTQPWVMGQLVCETIPRSNFVMISYGLDMDFQYMHTVTLTLEIWPCVKVMTHPWVMDNNCVKYYLDPTLHWWVMPRTLILGTCSLWPWRYDLESRSWHTLMSRTIIVWNIIQIGQVGTELYPGQKVTDRQTDRQGDSYIIPLKLCLWGYNDIP